MGYHDTGVDTVGIPPERLDFTIAQRNLYSLKLGTLKQYNATSYDNDGVISLC